MCCVDNTDPGLGLVEDREAVLRDNFIAACGRTWGKFRRGIKKETAQSELQWPGPLWSCRAANHSSEFLICFW